MEQTANLKLALIKPSEWQTTYSKDFLNALMGADEASNMRKIDAAVAALEEAVRTIPSPITGEQVTAKAAVAISKGNVVRLESTDGSYIAYLATSETKAISYYLGIADGDIQAEQSGSVTMVVAVTASPDDTIIEQNKRSQQKIWNGTWTEYEAISEKDGATLYFVEDDGTVGDQPVSAGDLAQAISAAEQRITANIDASKIPFAKDQSTIQAATVQSAIEELFLDVDDGKTAVASAITDKGVATSKDATYQQMADNIKAIQTGMDTADATIQPSDIRAGKIGYGRDGKVVGNVGDVDAATPSISVSGTGLITASTNQGGGFVTTGAKSATRQLPQKGPQVYTPSASNQTINAGQYLTGVQTIRGDANLVPDNIRSGVTIFGQVGSYSGDSPIFESLTSDNVSIDISGTTVTIVFRVSRPIKTLYGMSVGMRNMNHISYPTFSSDTAGLAFHLSIGKQGAMTLISGKRVKIEHSRITLVYGAINSTEAGYFEPQVWEGGICYVPT